MPKSLMQIGGTTKRSVNAAADAVVRVATCSPTPEVAVAALEALTHLGETKHVTVTGCTFTTAPVKPKRRKGKGRKS